MTEISDGPESIAEDETTSQDTAGLLPFPTSESARKWSNVLSGVLTDAG